MAQRPPVVLGSDGLLQQLQTGDTLTTALRVESYTSGAGNASGVASVTFSPPFTSIPTIIPLTGIVGSTVTVGQVISVSKTGCTLQLITSRGTLVLSSGPFQAGQGSTLPIVAIGS